MRRKKAPGLNKRGRRTIVLGKRVYRKIFLLTHWAEETPDYIEMGDYAWDQIEEVWFKAIEKQLLTNEIATIETDGAGLVAVVEDEQGHETRVPIVEKGTRSLREFK